MKKVLFVLAIAASVVACKKAEATTEETEAVDSVAVEEVAPEADSVVVADTVVVADSVVAE